jgi:hypothetical protein
LDQSNAVLLAGTEGAEAPFFSPDGKSIAFFADGKLKKIDASSGTPIMLCGAPSQREGSWGDDDGASLAHLITHDRRHLWQAEQVSNDANFPIV